MLSDHHNHNHNCHQNQNYCFFFASSRTIPGEKSSQAGWAKVEVENPGKLDPQEIEFKFHDQIFANQSLRWGPDVRAQPSCYTQQKTKTGRNSQSPDYFRKMRIRLQEQIYIFVKYYHRRILSWNFLKCKSQDGSDLGENIGTV